MQQDFNLVSLVRTLHTWRKPLVFITGGAAVLAVIVTLLLPNFYKATTVFYAASQDLFKPQKVFGYNQTEMYYYGSGEDIQRVITAASSHQVLNHLIDTFNLYAHYDIKPGSKKAGHQIREKLLDRYKVMRTKYDAIELSVEDTDPEIAAAIANTARERINDVLTGIIKGSQREMITSYYGAISAKELALTAIEDTLQKFQAQYGIYDPVAQAEYLSTLVTTVETQLGRDRAALESFKKDRSNSKVARDTIPSLTARIAGLEMQRDILTGTDSTNQNVYNLERFAKGKGRVELYTDAHRKAIGTLNLDREMLKQMEAALSLDVTALHLVESAAIPGVKSRPRRSLIVIAVTAVVFLVTVFGILLVESFKSHDWSFLKW